MDTAYARLRVFRFGQALSVLATVVSVQRRSSRWPTAASRLWGWITATPSIDGTRVWFCSDEHVTFAPERPLRVGARVRIQPAHLDPTLAYHERIHVVDGEQVLEVWMALYRAVLHHARNRLSRSLLEALGVYVSALNGCRYCVDHHAHGLIRLIGDEEGRRQWDALAADAPERAFAGRDLAAMRYAKALTGAAHSMERSQVQALRDAGFDDGEILEINQVVAYFAYANRTVLGLGITTEGDALGLSPSSTDDPDDWHHR